jgi:hypothetical protein
MAVHLYKELNDLGSHVLRSRTAQHSRLCNENKTKHSKYYEYLKPKRYLVYRLR